MTRIAITGGAGFIGQHLARALLTRGYDVSIFDDFHRDQLLSFDAALKPTVIEADVLNLNDSRALRNADILIHAAAVAGVRTVVDKPYRVLRVNIEGTANVLRAFAGKQIIFFSTSEVYGPRCFKASEMDALSIGPLTEPRWVYAASKLAGEHLVAGYGRERGIPWTVVRPFNVYGPGQLGDGAVANFIKRAAVGLPLIVHGDGTQVRAWCYVSDCVAAVVAMVENPIAYNHVFNVGNPWCTVTTQGLAERIAERYKVPIEHRAIAYPEIDLRVPDITNATTLLHWTPQVSLDEGLARIVGAP